jgi:hypothetical protein
VTEDFLSAGITDFRKAARYVRNLPYGRNSDRSDFRLVLREGRGTCSTKHALLAQLAKEQGIDVALTLGIYEMSERNTPGVGHVLDKYGLLYIPEAHCYLTYRGTRIDITRAKRNPAEPIARFLYEEIIDPEDIGKYKVDLHKRFLWDWVTKSDVAGDLIPEEVWAIREECIAALSGRGGLPIPAQG